MYLVSKINVIDSLEVQSWTDEGMARVMMENFDESIVFKDGRYQVCLATLEGDTFCPFWQLSMIVWKVRSSEIARYIFVMYYIAICNVQAIPTII